MAGLRKGIETVYADTRFRSRLEATWAAFFDRLGWEWVYEPEDLDGYVPDFVLKFAAAPVLVEVKPEYHVACLHEYTAKIERSGWRHEALIVGADWMLTGEHQFSEAIGLLAERDDDGWHWDNAEALICTKCGKRSFFHSSCSWVCRVSGCRERDLVWHSPLFGRVDDWSGLWAEAKNAVRWAPGAMASQRLRPAAVPESRR